MRSLAAAIAFENNDKNDKTVQITIQRVNTGDRAHNRKTDFYLRSTDKEFRGYLIQLVSNTLESIGVLSVIHGCQHRVDKCDLLRDPLQMQCTFGNHGLSSHSEETKQVGFLDFLVSWKN